MIDTQDKLEAFVKEHRLAMLTIAVRDFSAGDVWTTYFNRATNAQCAISTYFPKGSNEIYIVAHAKEHTHPVATITLG